MGASMSMDVHSEGAVELKQKRPRTSGHLSLPTAPHNGRSSLVADPASVGGDFLLYEGVRRRCVLSAHAHNCVRQ
jgi:hypothetical protein